MADPVAFHGAHLPPGFQWVPSMAHETLEAADAIFNHSLSSGDY